MCLKLNSLALAQEMRLHGSMSHSLIFTQVYIADYQSFLSKSDDSCGDSRKSLHNEEVTAARPNVHQTL